ncbi:hypothetical protein D3C72_799090 [compost metagenome]
MLGAPDQHAEACQHAGGQGDEGIAAEQLVEEVDLDHPEQRCPQPQQQPGQAGEHRRQHQGEAVLPGTFEQCAVVGPPMTGVQAELPPRQGNERGNRQADRERNLQPGRIQRGFSAQVPGGPGGQREDEHRGQPGVQPQAPRLQIDQRQRHCGGHGQDPGIPAVAPADVPERPLVGQFLGGEKHQPLQQCDQHDHAAGGP